MTVRSLLVMVCVLFGTLIAKPERGCAQAAAALVQGHRLVRPIDLNVGQPVGVETGTGKDIYAYALPDSNIPAPPGGSPGTNGIIYYIDSSAIRVTTASQSKRRSAAAGILKSARAQPG